MANDSRAATVTVNQSVIVCKHRALFALGPFVGLYFTKAAFVTLCRLIKTHRQRASVKLIKI